MADPVQTPPAPAPVNPADDLAQLTQNPVPSMVDEIKQFDSAHPEPTPIVVPDYQVMYNQGGKFKEQLEALAGSYRVAEAPRSVEKKVTQVEEIASSPEIEKKEMQGYIEKIEKEAELTNSITDDYTNKVLLSSSANQNPTITLPLTHVQVNAGLHHKVWEAVTWLAAWCLRQVKLSPGRVKYKS